MEISVLTAKSTPYMIGQLFQVELESTFTQNRLLLEQLLRQNYFQLMTRLLWQSSPSSESVVQGRGNQGRCSGEQAVVRSVQAGILF
ncbi:hypothetical protein PAAG_04450 [Paracoccidioides lutzii Pb01]|uniref:Uncharacterized protein n=1 Tax=Paracoccidioides lutzii (strain ATCC MYA-826 / Pb01) TaxID=502779 RepID=C1H106_PARBA|nr:hypothetical protein PAAG_04450 [Paracoccidioides lutzii Pb01]EEH33400.2 hypothetical protein PAAG_04450 [Paracoccidioides lutzii Pb01]